MTRQHVQPVLAELTVLADIEDPDVRAFAFWVAAGALATDLPLARVHSVVQSALSETNRLLVDTMRGRR